MESKYLTLSKVPDDPSERKAWPVASTRLDPEDLALLDAAAYKLKAKRSALVAEGTMRLVREVLGLSEAA